MPIVQRLIRKGVPPAVALTYMLAAPALNPLALFSTWLAFRNQDPWLMVMLRFLFSGVVLIFLGFWFARLRPEQMLRADFLMGGRRTDQTPNPSLVLVPRPGASWGGLQQFTGAVVRDFTGVLLFLIIGAAAAALFSTGFNRSLLAPLGQNIILGPLAGHRAGRTALPLQHDRRVHHRRLHPFLAPGQARVPRRRTAHRPEALLALPERVQALAGARLVAAGTWRYLHPHPALFLRPCSLNASNARLVFLAPAAVMSAWATVMLHTLLVGHINRLLSPMFRSYVGIAAVVLLILSALHLLLYRPSPERVPGAGRQLGRWLVLLVPVIAASVLSPAALSDTTAGCAPPARRSRRHAQHERRHRPRRQGRRRHRSQPARTPMEVTDLITGQPHAGADQEVRRPGRCTSSVPLFTAGQPAPKLMRWIMWCCAADAQPASVATPCFLFGPGPGRRPVEGPDKWLDVTGIARFPPHQLGQVIPDKIESVTSVKQDRRAGRAVVLKFRARSG